MTPAGTAATFADMIRPLRLLLVAALALPLLAACEEEQVQGPTNRRESLPPKGPEFTGDVCLVIQNRAPFTITGRVQLKSRERGTFRLSRGQSTRICLSGTTYGNYTVSFVLTNFVTIPIFSCYTITDQAIQVFARQSQDGWIYSASCQ